MRALLRFTLSLAVLAWCGMAQRGGGHSGGGGHASMGGGAGHASASSGYHGGGYGAARGGGGSVSAYRGAGIGSAYRGGYGYGGRGYGYGYAGHGYGYGGYRYRGGYRPYYGWGYPWYGFGFSYWPSYYYGYYNYYPYDYYVPDTYSDPAYSYSPAPAMTYAPAPAETYAQAQPRATYGEVAHPVTRSYDEYGQETASTGGSATNASPIYLFALKDGSIQGAGSYWISGETLHYVTLDRQEKQVALSSIDRTLTRQLNRERRVPLNLPEQ